MLEKLYNEAMRMERFQFLGAGPYERSIQRIGRANGFKDKTVQTRVGAVQLNIPQVRGLPFYPQSLERGCRSERALKLAIAEMYVMGVSTIKVTKITEALTNKVFMTVNTEFVNSDARGGPIQLSTIYQASLAGVLTPTA